MMPKQKELPIIQKTYDIIKWLIPKIEKFPRTQKFVLGDRIEMLLNAENTKPRQSSPRNKYKCLSK